MVAGATAPGERAAAACLLSVTYLGAPYIDSGPIPRSEIGAAAGRGTLPPCNDTPGFDDGGVATPVTVRRVTGVAPRFAVALTGNSRTSQLLMADGIPCRRIAVAGTLACLRGRSTRLREGPSLIAPLSAAAGSVIRLGVRVRDPRLRRGTTFGVESVLQRREGARWRSVFHLVHPLAGEPPPDPVAVGTPGIGFELIRFRAGRPRPVRLPTADPGLYRIVKQVTSRGRTTRVVAYLTVREAA